MFALNSGCEDFLVCLTAGCTSRRARLSALIRLNNLLTTIDFGHVLLTIHDSLVFEIRVNRLDEAMPYIVREMCTPPFESTTPFRVDIEYGPILGEVHRYGEKGTLYDVNWARQKLTIAA